MPAATTFFSLPPVRHKGSTAARHDMNSVGEWRVSGHCLEHLSVAETGNKRMPNMAYCRCERVAAEPCRVGGRLAKSAEDLPGACPG